MKKSELLNWLQEEYQQWEALLEQIGPARPDQPGVNGDWSVKDIVAHLTGWQPTLTARIQAAQRGETEPPPPWPAHLQTEDEINAWIYETNHGRRWMKSWMKRVRYFTSIWLLLKVCPTMSGSSQRGAWCG